jgi:hypothetical protein
MANQFSHTNETAKEARDFVAFDLCEVVEVVPNSEGGVRVRPFSTSDTSEKPFAAKYTVDSYGDINQPQTNDLCVVGYSRTTDPIILGFWYAERDAPDHEIDERVIGHRQSNATIRFKGDGSVVVSNDSTTVEVASDGTVVVNDGESPVVTDVTAASTNSNGGITELDVTYSDDLYVP